MKIYKKFNNNVVQTYDDDLAELIVIGSGIAFNKQVGGWIDEKKIEKKFLLQDSFQQEMIGRLLKEIPIGHFEISEKIVAFAEEYLKTELNTNIHITLADHLSFAISRHDNGLSTRNPLLWDIKNLYEKEYVIGLYAVELIQKELGVDFPEDEAGFVTMHIVDALYNQEELVISKIATMTNQMVKIVKYQLKLNLQEDSLIYRRFITHLKFFAQRILKNEHIEFGDDEITKNFIANYPDAYKGANFIVEFIEKKYNYAVNDGEKLYLAVHLQRMMREK